MKSLFSNLAPAGAPAEHQQNNPSGSVLSSAALVAGTTIGAGILALPAVTLPAGVLPSTVVMVGVWLYMLASGLLVAEANLQAMGESGRADIGLLTTIQQTLGRSGAIAAGVVYVFIHYALLVAYITRGGDILAMALAQIIQWFGLSQPVLPMISPVVSLLGVSLWWGHVLFALLFGVVLYWGSERFIGRLNAVLVAIVVMAFGLLLALILGQVEFSRWQVQHWEVVSALVPTMFVAFVYQNVVPVVTTQLGGDGRRIRQAIGLGSLVPLLMFASWNAFILGSLDADTANMSGIDPIEVLRQGQAHPLLGVAVSVFSEFAIATSFIGFVFGLLSVFQDIFSPSFREKAGPLPLYLLIFLPPLMLSFADPNIFFEAIELAGAFGNSVLFGIIPAVMAWKYRYRPASETRESQPLVPGGRVVLTVMIGVASAVVVQNALRYAEIIPK